MLQMTLPVLLLVCGAVAVEVVSGSSATGLDDEQCERNQIGTGAPAGSNLLQVHTSGHEDKFGPHMCVGLKRSVAGSCVLRTRCKGRNITETEFAFVCFNPGASMPHALHSFGRGGFSLEETFDTKVHCKTCMSVDTSFRTGSSVVRNALAALPLSHLPSLTGAVKASAAYSAHELAQFKPKEAAVFGPAYCISTFRAPAGTCLIRTRCANADLSKFNVGVTCLDSGGGYTRYLFGKDTFKAEETFDTLITCEKCLGVGQESSLFAMHGLMPKKVVEDVSTLKTDVQTLNEKVRVLQQAGQAGHQHSDSGQAEESESKKTDPMGPMPSHPSRQESPKKNSHQEADPMGPMPSDSSSPSHEESDPMGPMPGAPGHSRKHLATQAAALSDPSQEADPTYLARQTDALSDFSQEAVPPPSMRTVMMSRRYSATPQPSVTPAPAAIEMAEESGAESASVDVGPVQVVSHRRGAAIADLLRRAAPTSPSEEE